jgi:CBS domain-containing protein
MMHPKKYNSSAIFMTIKNKGGLLKKFTDMTPFNLLDKKNLKDIYPLFTREKHKKGSIVLTQEISKVDHFYILLNGHAQYYYEETGNRTLKGELNPGDTFGGISILLNDTVSTRTLEIIEEAEFMCLNADVFLDLCDRCDAFCHYFTAEFGKCMQHPSYAGIILRHFQDKQLNLPFFNQPISAIFRPNIATCPWDTPIADAAKKMVHTGGSAILIKDDHKQIRGLMTDADLKTRVLAEQLDVQTPVKEIMSQPIVTISADCQVFEAFLKMTDQDKRHLAVTSKTSDIIGIINEKDLISAQARSTYLLIKTVHSAQTIDQLSGIHTKLCELLLDPIKNGTNPEHITHLITTFSEAILDKIITFTLAEIGPAPCRFVFMIMGSEGRDEQTLISDQDNALIFEDIDDPEKLEDANAYFARFSKLTCDQLAIAGYKYCDGDNMAKNPKWCQPLSVWKEYFMQWLRVMDPEKVMYSGIFFDFRGAWGDMELTHELRAYLHETIKKWPGILRCLTENSLSFKPPLSFFGKFIVEEKGVHKGSFDIKKALMPITDFARIHSLKQQISSTNTLTRLFRLYTKRVIDNRLYLNLVRSYTYLMRLRFLRQITTLMDENQTPDNYINPSNLSTLDQTMLKEIFKIMDRLHQKMKMEFIGTA